jgi:hypothetical protein
MDHARVLASVAKEYIPFIELKDKKSKHNFFHIELLLTRKHFNTDFFFLFIDVHSHRRNTTYSLIRGKLIEKCHALLLREIYHLIVIG